MNQEILDKDINVTETAADNYAMDSIKCLVFVVIDIVLMLGVGYV